MSILKTMFAWFFFLLVFSGAAAQGYDRVWAQGSPVSTVTFDGDSVVPAYLQDSTVLSFLTIGNICDRSGKFLFFTNGLNVYNRLGRIMPNGDALNYPSEYYSIEVPQGMASREGATILPKPSDTNQYYIFHNSAVDTFMNTGGYEALNFYYSIVDMRRDSGRGDLIKKNVPIIQDQLLSASRMAVCRHANGRDWWIIKNTWESNIYYSFLLTPDTLLGSYAQTIGPNYGGDEIPSYSCFNLQGTKYASVTSASHVVVMDFDRCSGQFSNPMDFYNNDSGDPIHNPISGGVTLAFSPNGRFLYVVNPIELNQYDLASSPIRDSVRIATDTAEFYQMGTLQLAPNGKIYLSCWNGGSYKLHVINQPDSFGLACDFQLFGQDVFSQSTTSLPYFPNFRLGPLTGSGCDTIPNGIRDIESSNLKIEPNPASSMVTISYPHSGNDEWSIDLYDNIGNAVYSKKEQTGADKTSIDVSGFAAGMYVVRVAGGSGVVLNAKLIIAR